LSSSLPIAFVEVRVFSHATEDEDKVLCAAQSLLPSEFVEKVIFEKIRLTGHYGNPITLIEARIKERDIIRGLLEKLAAGLSSLDKEQLCNEITQHVEKGKLYLRLDKQSIFLGEFKLGLSDSMHLKVQFKKSNLEEMLNVCRRFGMLP
jgi:RNA binding exosome subunit